MVSGTALSQPVAQPIPPEQQEIHQLNLDEPVKVIEMLQYRDTGEPLEHELGPDGKSIIIKGYDGKSPIAVSVIKTDGTRSSFYRSRCQIDVYIPEI
jgi:hypothetical protein